ncbi:nucleotidyltransferase family protein [Streptomyces albus subsp. chlorinus]|uniref:nucleotidyltransferase family protein n=1 Tax=Streptomyces albus TaxID=1888 RepID=UPI00156E3224|nr:nucleotidyltransferase family protein [Streptomyces albus]NSC25208.1 nucleotidyltransferase family protein [Streptomyces albus subsp. chlorinus]
MNDPATAPAHGSAAERLRRILVGNTVLTQVLDVAARADLPQWYVSAGCLAQTVWNARTSRQPPDHGIRDYDLIYFDDSDLSWEAENEAIERVRSSQAVTGPDIEVRNQARVHLWYEQRFGVPCPRYGSAEEAIDTYPTTATSIGVRVEDDGHWRFYAPFGFDDLLNLVIRPNRVLAPRAVYEKKVARWREHWPELEILPWE